MSNLDPNIAKTSPNLYAAALNSNLNSQQANQFNQVMGTVALNKELTSLPKDKAAKRWNSLSQDAQDQIRAMYGEAPYIPQPAAWRAPTSVGNIAHDAWRVGTNTVGMLLSPFRTAFKVAGDYNRIINTPYLVTRQIQQGESIFNKKVWGNAWNGNKVFDNKSLNALYAEYGNADTFVAMKTLEGLKPGEIIDAYGKVDSAIINAIDNMVNNTDKFKGMLNQFKAAQVSPGRDIARVLFNTPPTDNKLYGSSEWTKTSGTIDLVYQILIDPLTWITGGASKVVTKGEKLGQLYEKGIKTIDQIFADKDVVRTWETVGPVFKKLADERAAGSKVAANNTREYIKNQFPAFSDDRLIDLIIRHEAFDVEGAKRFAKEGDNMIHLLNGRVDGTTFYRHGIPLAAKSRYRASGLNKILGDYFNGSVTEDAEKAMSAKVKDVADIGIANDPNFVYTSKALDAERASMNSVRRKVGRLVARFPGAEQIGVMDHNVAKSLPVVKSLARTIYSKDFAGYFAEHFLQSNPEDRVILLRGLYTQIMYAMGLHGEPKGQELMNKILQDKFGDSTTYASMEENLIPPQALDHIEHTELGIMQPEAGEGGQLIIKHAGPIHNYNSKPYIGNLPWSSTDGGVSLADYALSAGPGSIARQTIDAIGGASRNHITRKLVNGWSIATLFPRLGIRSAIDEAFFYSMMAPTQDIIRLASGRKLNKGIMAFTGAEKAVPPIKRAILDALKKNPAKFLSEEERYSKTTLDGVEYMRLKSQAEIAERAQKILDEVVPREIQEYMYQAMIHHPEVASAMVNSIIGKSGLEGGLSSADLSATLLTNSHLTNMFRELGFKPTGNYKVWDTSELEKINESAVAAAHFDNWFMRFTKNSRKFGNNYMNPGVTFMYCNGLKDPEDWVNAKKILLNQIGIDENRMVVDKAALDDFLNLSQQTSRDRTKGFTDVQSAVNRIDAMLVDMYRVFHGSSTGYNQGLYDRLHELAAQIKLENPGYSLSKSMRKALDSVDFKTFNEMTGGAYRIRGQINTDLDFTIDPDNANNIFAKLSQWADDKFGHPMEWMDAQNNHIFRQPALWYTYAKTRKQWARLEEKSVERMIASNPGMPVNLVKQLVEKQYTEYAMNHAAHSVLKYVDNPQIRSNLAWALRNTGRFYRATEDFYRRVYRLKDVTPNVLYKIRLAHLGLQSNGFIHPDQNGDPYLMMPADSIIFHALQAPLSVFGADVQQPMFNDFTLKLALANPSFQQDAGQPTLSGPFAAVPVLAVQNILRGWGGDLGKRIALDLDNLVLGNVNQNLTWTKAIVPASVARVLNAVGLGPDAQQQEVSAGMQAIAYNAANGILLSPEKVAALPDTERATAIDNYLRHIRVTAHNITFMRGFLGLISPIAPTVQESKGVPDYLLNLGINGLRPEFSDILQSVMRNSRGKIQDPYEAALMAFTGKYPGKLVYTVSRDDKQIAVVVNKTKETQKWMLGNQKAIDKYGDAALIFAPHVGQYDTNVYTWMQAAGMMKQRSLDDYYKEVAVAQDRQRYFDLKMVAEQAMEDPSYNLSQRQEILASLKAEQTAMKQANPMLEYALNSKNYGIGKQEEMLANLSDLIAQNAVKLTPQARTKMQMALNIVNAALAAIKSDALGDVVDAGAFKQEQKNMAMQKLRELDGVSGRGSLQDPMLAEANRAIFQPILDFYVRNNLKAGL